MDTNGAATREKNWTSLYRGVLAGMVSVTLALVGTVYLNMAKDSDRLERDLKALDERVRADEIAASGLRQQVFDDERRAR